ncbi:hypothetical protein MTP03_24030 [Tsukamurella sp. PLM1]|nr:hypothetical protein MTP03_24030 [Tsukamurella sp. PLM1]
MEDAFAPARLGPVDLRNRIVKAATFEGRTPDALVTDDLIDFHTEFARGGVGMTTVAYCAVAPEGARSAANCGCDPRRCPACAASPTPSTPRAPRSPPSSVTRAPSRTAPSTGGRSRPAG